MFARNKRVLWLLNHRTLMPYELPLLLRLGFEVFTPKVIPKSVGFRSGAVDYSYDSSLTIPARVLARLNAFDFYETDWPSDIVAIVNRYFGTAYTIPYGVQVREVVQKFEGQIMFRAFGLDETVTYQKVLPILYGPDLLDLIKSLGDRFRFAQGYEQLAECESRFFADRQIFLPLGVPEKFWETANSYTGIDRRLLFVCPNCVTNPYYARIYQEFKEDFSDIPHVIIGVQDVPVDDDSVLGFVSDDELHRLYRECAVMYYHSTEPRHVHYSPIEAAINGMPVVYYADSLLGRMTPQIRNGRSASLEEARACIKSILSGDDLYTHDVIADQRSLPEQFSDEFCHARWMESLIDSGYRNATMQERTPVVLLREAKRMLMMPFALGLSSIPSKAPNEMVSAQDPSLSTILDGGIDFAEIDYPPFVKSVNGLSFAESGGRWSVGSAVTIVLGEDLPRRFRLILYGVAYGPNVGATFRVKIGNASREFAFRGDSSRFEQIVLEFRTRRSANRIDIRIPKPTIPPNDNRAVGLALKHIALEMIER